MRANPVHHGHIRDPEEAAVPFRRDDRPGRNEGLAPQVDRPFRPCQCVVPPAQLGPVLVFEDDEEDRVGEVVPVADHGAVRSSFGVGHVADRVEVPLDEPFPIHTHPHPRCCEPADPVIIFAGDAECGRQQPEHSGFGRFQCCVPALEPGTQAPGLHGRIQAQGECPGHALSCAVVSRREENSSRPITTSSAGNGSVPQLSAAPATARSSELP